MKTSITINQPVTVTSLAFGRGMKTYPRRIEFNGTSYGFIDSGLCAVVRSGERISRIFTMSDGQQDYRLKSDGGNWTLLTMTC